MADSNTLINTITFPLLKIKRINCADCHKPGYKAKNGFYYHEGVKFHYCVHCDRSFCWDCREFGIDRYGDPICLACLSTIDGRPKCCMCRIVVSENAFTCQVCQEKKFCGSCRELSRKNRSGKPTHDCIFE